MIFGAPNYSIIGPHGLLSYLVANPPQHFEVSQLGTVSTLRNQSSMFACLCTIQRVRLEESSPSTNIYPISVLALSQIAD